MKRLTLIFAIALPALSQVIPDPEALNQALARTQKELESVDLKQLESLDLKIPGEAIAKAEAALAQLQAKPLAAPFGPAPFLQRGGRAMRTGDAAYDAGTRALDEHKYDEAVQLFDRTITAKSARADGALYWKAYALNRLGRRDEALAAIAALRSGYANSRWLNDAQALEVEARQRAGQPVSPADETNEDLKLMAINGLMNADPDRAIPLLEGILKGSSTPKVKERAMFVLTQSRAPRAQQILLDFAKGGSNPDLQIRAIRYMGAAGQNTDQLASIYAATADAEVKSAILRALMAQNGSAKLLELARAEKDPKLRMEAIRYFANSGGTQLSTLTGLYASESDSDVKKEIVRGLMARNDAKDLVDLARKETDPTMKKNIVQYLSAMRSKEATDYMLELLK
jgi:hypothetical protein